jgi:DNA-3-methyladenine glycosylase
MLQFAQVTRLSRSFFARPTLAVARGLLGQRLVKLHDGQRLSGLITEVEAYIGESDLACHARAGRTPRTAVMYGQPGTIYIYFNYGMHWMLNIVTGAEGFPAAVLIRAMLPVEGLPLMQERRRNYKQLANGPAKLTQALDLNNHWNGADLCAPGADLFIEACPLPAAAKVRTAPRVGITNTPEPWLSKRWNFSVELE